MNQTEQETQMNQTIEPEILQPNLYECSDCGKKFRVKKFYELHRAEHKDPDIYKCCQCNNEPFDSNGSLEIHKNLMHSQFKLYKCGDCDKVFRVRSFLESHMSTHVVGKSENEILCKGTNNYKLFESKSIGKTSRKRKYESQVESQPNLGAEFNDKANSPKTISGSNPSTQLKENSGTNLNCREKRKSKPSLKKQLLKNSLLQAELQLTSSFVARKLLPLECRVKIEKLNLNKATKMKKSQKTSRNNKENSKTPAKLKSFKCEICGKLLAHRGALINHSKIHLKLVQDAKFFKCKNCSKTFSKFHQLISHKQIHSNENS